MGKPSQAFSLTDKEISQRVIEVFKKLEVDQKDMAEKTRYTEGMVSRILAKKSKASDKFLGLFSAAYGISLEWLKYGQGEMMEQGTVGEKGGKPPASPEAGWLPIFDVLLEEFRKLPVEEQYRVIAEVIEREKSLSKKKRT